jgi:hypothetical protein
MNLISAYGLPGTERMDMGAMLATLDAWAERVGAFTRESLPRYHSRPAQFGSLARFKVTAMIRVLAREIGVRYNPARITDPENFTDPEDSFIHGLLGPRRMGTCASLPFLLTALGRRLNYPLKIVLAPAHCFCRWDGLDERFNIEWHADGLNTHPDEHYRHWPHEWTPKVIEDQRARPTFLVSLTPQQELAHCAHTRAAQLDIAGRRDEAVAAVRVAYRLWPTYNHGVWLTHLTTKAKFPARRFPHLPCEETAGQTAFGRLVEEEGAVVIGSSIFTR